MSQIPPDASDGVQLMVTFKVGPNQRQFLIHLDIICQHSPIFDKALKSEFKEGKEKEITLEETEEDVLKVDMHWMYTGRVPSFRNKGQKDPTKWGPRESQTDAEGNEVELTWDYMMSQAYIFGAMCDIWKFCSAIHGAFQHRFEPGDDKTPTYPSHATIIRLFNNTPENAAMRKTFARQFAKHWRPAGATQAELKLFKELPIEFTLMSMASFAEVRDRLSE
ncbi:hypothetical protein BKA80DRAFT_311594 [Phyllosticta citrichinensis]